jgi:hypothetical protein
MEPPMSNDLGSVDVAPFEDANAEPPMPTAPVVNPYPGGVGGGAAAAAPAGSNVLSSGTPSNGAPETQFDYANPQRYFDMMRQRQQQQTTQQPGASPVAPYPGSTLDRGAATPVPTATPSATGTSSRPGIAPTPATAPPQQQFFNPYNLPPEQLNGNPPATTGTPGSSVEPDRSKYANPYVPSPTTKPPQ